MHMAHMALNILIFQKEKKPSFLKTESVPERIKFMFKL